MAAERSPALKLVRNAGVPVGSTQRIVGAIVQAIVERRLMPGTKLGESQLGELFSVSRTVVRQALNERNLRLDPRPTDLAKALLPS